MFVGVVLIIVIIALMGLIMPVMVSDLDISKTKLAEYKYQNSIMAREQMIDDLKTIYRTNYDYINIPFALVPGGSSNALESSLEKFIASVNDPQYVKKEGYPVLFNRDRVCTFLPKEVRVQGGGTKEGGRYICTSLEGNNSLIKKHLKEIADLDTKIKGAEAISKMIKAVHGDWFVTFEKINEKYINVELPSMVIKMYPENPDGKIPNHEAIPVEISFNDVISSMVDDAKRINDGIYEKYGEYAKRQFKGLVKTDIVSQTNPFAVIGDALNMKERIDSGETNLPPFLIVGNKALSGFATGDSIVINFSRLDGNYGSVIGGSCEILSANLKSPNATVTAPQFSDKYYYGCADRARTIYTGACDTNEDKNCERTPNSLLKIPNFCLSTEACFVEYSTNEDETLKDMKTSSIDYMLEKKFNLGIKSYTNPFYPNYAQTLDKDFEQKGLIFSSNNEGIASNNGQYFFIIGMKYVPTGFDSYSQNSKDFYILNKYVIQGK